MQEVKKYRNCSKVNDIDVIVTGDSHYLYGNDELRGLKLPVIYEYPLEFKIEWRTGICNGRLGLFCCCG